MLVEEQKYLEKIIDKLRKELLTAPEGWRLAMFSFLLCYRKSELFRSFKKNIPHRGL